METPTGNRIVKGGDNFFDKYWSECSLDDSWDSVTEDLPKRALHPSILFRNTTTPVSADQRQTLDAERQVLRRVATQRLKLHRIHSRKVKRACEELTLAGRIRAVLRRFKAFFKR
ncbi:hypothetical protein L596_018659 [Steinernema carpocapsae]|uniref:Uncharacterized protein n=1 Tax=Steinernema carpocapsae TaxID=34508 RepID=A0A4U5N616_STECR|nr:hypothetical protein L596_018659 [Steinernema carpocapsae]